MKPEEIEARFAMIERELQVSGDTLDKLKVDLMADVEALKIDSEAVKRLIKRINPEHYYELMKIREEVAREFESTNKKRAA